MLSYIVFVVFSAFVRKVWMIIVLVPYTLRTFFLVMSY